MVGDLVSVSVGGDDQGAASPLSPLPPTGGYRTEGCNPWFVGVEGGVEDGFCSGFDEVAAPGQSPLHVRGHGAGGFGNQPGNEKRCPSSASRSGGSGGGLGEAVVDNGGDVVGVSEPTSLDEARQEGVDVVVVGFGAAQFRSQGAEGVGVDDDFRLLAGAPGATDQGGPAVVLGCGGDGFVFGGELGDRAPPVLLGGDGLACRQLSTAVLEHAVEDRAGGGVGIVTRVRGGVIVGAVEYDVGPVRFASAGHGDVQVLPRGVLFDSDVTASGTRYLVSVPDNGDSRWSVSYTHLTLPTILRSCRSRWSPYH